MIELSEVELPVVPHKAVAEVSKMGKLYERLVVVNHGWQSDPTDESKNGWRQRSGVEVCSAAVVALVVVVFVVQCSVV